MCSSPEFQRKVNDILVIIKVAINQNYLPKVLLRVMFKLLDALNFKVDVGVTQQQDYETCYQTNTTII